MQSQTGYSANKDNKALEDARVKRMKEEQARKEKEKLQRELNEKKGFIISTTRVINEKTTDLHQIEAKSLRISNEIRANEAKLKSLDMRLSNSNAEAARLQKEEMTTQSELLLQKQEEMKVEAKGRQVDKDIEGLKADEEKAVRASQAGAQTFDRIKTVERETERQLSTIDSASHSKQQQQSRDEESIKKTEQDIGQLTRQLDIKKTELNRLNAEKSKDILQISELKQQHDALETRLRDLKNSEKDSSSNVEVKTAGINQNIAQKIRDKQAVLAEADKGKKKADEEKRLQTAVQAKISQKSGELENLKHELDQMRKEIDAMRKESAELDKKAAEVRSILDQSVRSRTTLEADAKRLEAQMR
jgi:chromosome segregation protein